MTPTWNSTFAKFALLAAVLVALAGVAVMLLWNALVPQIFGATPISWLQALGLIVLSRLLLGRWGGGPRGHRRCHRSRFDGEPAPDGTAAAS